MRLVKMTAMAIAILGAAAFGTDVSAQSPASAPASLEWLPPGTQIVNVELSPSQIEAAVQIAARPGMSDGGAGRLFEEVLVPSLSNDEVGVCSHHPNRNHRRTDLRCHPGGQGTTTLYQAKSGTTNHYDVCRDIRNRRYRHHRFVLTSDLTTTMMRIPRCRADIERLASSGMLYVASITTETLHDYLSRYPVVAVTPTPSENDQSTNDNNPGSAQNDDGGSGDNDRPNQRRHTRSSGIPPQLQNHALEAIGPTANADISGPSNRLSPLAGVRPCFNAPCIGIGIGIGVTTAVFSQSTLDACGLTTVSGWYGDGTQWVVDQVSPYNPLRLVPDEYNPYSPEVRERHDKFWNDAAGWASDRLRGSMVEDAYLTVSDGATAATNWVEGQYRDSLAERFFYGTNQRVASTCDWVHYQAVIQTNWLLGRYR